MTDDELKTFLKELERKLLEPKRFVVTYTYPPEWKDHDAHVIAFSVKDAYDSFMLQRELNTSRNTTRVRRIDPWTEARGEWRAWEAQPFVRIGKS